MAEALPSVDALDERVARGIAFEAREMHERGRGASAYIQSYVAEYLDDTAGVLRQLHACQGDSGAAARRVARTLAWREAAKVYPARRAGGEALRVDARGLVLVRSRQAPAVAGRLGAAQARTIGALEDARVALRAAYERFGVAARAAVVVRVESVRLADAAAVDGAEAAALAAAHYPRAVARVYVTAASSVLLGHARQALRPALRRLGPALAQHVVFVLDAALAAEAAELGAYIAASRRTAQPPPPLPLPLSALERLRGPADASSLGSDAGDFQTAHEALPPSRSSAVSLPCHARRGSSNSDGASSASTAVGAAGAPKAAMTPVQLASLQRAVLGVQRMLGAIGDGIGAADSRATLAATRARLAHQADVLMSAVAALSLGVARMRPGRADEPDAPDAPAAALLGGGVALRLLLGRRRHAALAALRAVAARALRRAARAGPLLLLAFRHLRLHALVLWAAALLAWNASGAVIWHGLAAQLRRGIACL
ncbi:hypothetical protein H4R18_005124 [Coemansia javaensis]|uniref:CRAL-TRIO domain-containing protein n=1 Tax=Coemansia javaensis TaxID=2761396 RepID=A0A9W8H601_9FUNG|nr:hypothetical protein H4R18_005124 [Coemansia javaensis]